MATLEEVQAENAKLQKQLADASKGGSTDDEKKRLEFLEAEHKTLIQARDKAKEEKRLADEKRLNEQGEFKTLAEQRQATIDALTAEQQKAADQLGAYTKRDEDRLTKMLGTVPDNFKALITEDLPLLKRLEMAETFAQTKPTPPGHRPPGEGGEGPTLTSAQKIAKGLSALAK